MEEERVAASFDELSLFEDGFCVSSSSVRRSFSSASSVLSHVSHPHLSSSALLAGLASLSGRARVSRRKCLRLASLHVFPAENRFVRSCAPHLFVLTHFAVARPSLSLYGRLYVLSSGAVLLSLSSLFSGPSNVLFSPQQLLASLRCEGSWLLLDAPDTWLLCPLAQQAESEVRKAATAAMQHRFSDVSLTDQLIRERQQNNDNNSNNNNPCGPVPRPLLRVREFLAARCGEEGIFRISGSAKVVKRLMAHVDEGCLELRPSLATADVASLFKLMIGKLELRLNSSVLENKAAITWLFEFLRECSSKSATSKMTDTNLAMVFTPILFPDLDLADYANANKLVLAQIQNNVV